MNVVGKPIDRVDGHLKVTGQALYTSDFKEANMTHAVIFQSSIASGKIKKFDLSKAHQIQGVVDIMTFENAPKIHKPKPKPGGGLGEDFLPLQDNKIFYNGQAIGVVVAETLEAAQHAANLIEVTYSSTDPVLDLESNLDKSYLMHEMMGQKLNLEKGNTRSGLKKSEVVIKQTYSMPVENHNPMEPSGTLAIWNGDKLKLYDTTQGVSNIASMMSEVFKLEKDGTLAITKFVGGGFGCKGALWPHEMLAVMAAKKAQRPVKLVLTRQQMFTGVGHRAKNIQILALGASRDGQLQAIEHTTTNNTAVNKDYSERCGNPTKMLYSCENRKIENKVVKLNFQVPTFMRAPGECSGTFALESGMDELAFALKMDPIDLRLKNYAETDPEKNHPFSGKKLKECYALGAEKFGWSKRKFDPLSQRIGDHWTGMGMATATYPAVRFAAKASVEFFANGEARVRSGTQDIGTGTYTIMSQIAADELGIALEKVDFDLGDSRYPKAGVSGGSTTAASVGSAIQMACAKIKSEWSDKSVKDAHSPLFQCNPQELQWKNAELYLPKESAKRESLSAFLRRQNQNSLHAEGECPNEDEKGKKFSTHSFGAQFVEVQVHCLTGEVRVSRMLGAFACGKILNQKTARNQFMGGMIFGLGAALMEKTEADLHSGRLVIKDLADYHVPVHSDIPPIEVLMLEDIDLNANPLGAKGIGEIGIVGMSAAIANAVFNATGVRIRDLPITPDKMVTQLPT